MRHGIAGRTGALVRPARDRIVLKRGSFANSPARAEASPVPPRSKILSCGMDKAAVEENMPPVRWLTIVGIGEDGVEGLSPAARLLLQAADLVVGGKRHLALAAPLIAGRQMPWPSPIEGGIETVLAQRPRPVAVLASGDPFCDGVGPMLAAGVRAAKFLSRPAPSSLSLALSRLGWPMRQIATISFCGRPLARLAPLLQPARRVLALSADATTPAAIADYLCTRGFGRSVLHVMEALGGPRERIRTT